jgi:hypothetical protein
MREKLLSSLAQPQATEECESLNAVLAIARAASFDAHDFRVACERFVKASKEYETTVAFIDQVCSVLQQRGVLQQSDRVIGSDGKSYSVSDPKIPG